MSASLVPVVISREDLRRTIGCKDQALLQRLIEENREDFLEIDGFDCYFDDFQSEIEAEYDAYVRGDFRFKAEVVSRESMAIEEENSPDTQIDGILAAATAGNEAALTDRLSDFVGDLFGEAMLISDGEDDTPIREATTGAALVDLILDREQDPASGAKYAVALMTLSQHLGRCPDHDSWVGIDSRSFDLITRVCRVSTGTSDLSFWEALFGIPSPISLPESDDGLNVGLIPRQALGERLERFTKFPDGCENLDQDAKAWLEQAIAEVADWYQLAVQTDRDLMFFYG